jgi:phospholipase/carboxylesterase
MYDISPQTLPPDGAIILLHGWGANGKDLLPLAEALRLPRLRYVALEGKIDAPMTGGYGKGWFMFPPTESATEEIKSSRRQIMAAIDRLIDEGISAEKIVLMGFSQGGSMALNILVNSQKKVGAVVVMSGFFLDQEALKQKDNLITETPIFAGHGTHDNLVPLHLAKESILSLNDAGFVVEWHEYPCEHRIMVEELQDIRAFLEKVL